MEYLVMGAHGWLLAYAGGALVMLAFGVRNSALMMTSLHGLGIERTQGARTTAALVILMALMWPTVVTVWILTDSWPDP